MFTTTYHSGQDKYPWNTSGPAVDVGCPLGRSTFKIWPWPSAIAIVNTWEQTILHVIYLAIAFSQTFVEWIPARSPVLRCYQTRIRKNREICNHHVWRTQVHPGCCARHASSRIRNGRSEALVSPTSMDGSSWTLGWVRPDWHDDKKDWPRTFSFPR